jgi:hypothetical protein
MSSNLNPRNMQILQSLHDIIGWSTDVLIRVREGDDIVAARTLKKVIDTMENPVVIKNLKEVLEELRKPL